MFSREEVKAITDKVIDMAKADAVEVEFNGGERSATRFANSNITANMVQFDRTVSHHRPSRQQVGIDHGARFRRRDAEAGGGGRAEAGRGTRARTPTRPSLLGPQEYEPVDAALPSGVNYGPAERARAVRQSLDICDKKGVLGSGYIPKVHQTTCSANSKGLFAYYQYAEASFILTARTRDGGGSGWAGITGVKDTEPDRRGAAHRDRGRQGAQEPEGARARARPLHRDPRAAAGGAVPVADDWACSTRAPPKAPVGNYFSGKERGTTKVGEKVFSEQFTLKSDIGNPILRQSPIGADGLPARDVTWIEKGVLKNLYYDRQWATRQKKEPTPATTNNSLVMEGSDMTARGDDQEHAPRPAGHVLLVHPRRSISRRCSIPA